MSITHNSPPDDVSISWRELYLRVELRTSSLPRKCSTTELIQRGAFRAEDGAQTRDPQLGRLVLYRLSYFRVYVPKIIFSSLKNAG